MSALVVFAIAATLFFAVLFGYAWRRSGARSDPELDLLLAELALEPGGERASAAAIGGARRIARAYIVLGALVTALGLAAVWQSALGAGDARVVLYPMIAIVVLWAAATPRIIRTALAGSRAVLEPLGLAMVGSPTLTGERFGREVKVGFAQKGTTVRIAARAPRVALNGDEIMAAAGRGDSETWEGVEARGTEDGLTVNRPGHRGASWLWDLWLAERLLEDAAG